MDLYEQAGRRAAQAVMRTWDDGWRRLGEDMQRDLLAAEVFFQAVGSGEPTVSTETLRRIYAAAREEAGLT